MGIEIDILNGDESWPIAEPLFATVWPPAVLEKLPWGRIQWAHADLRVLIEAGSGGLACHVGIHFRTVIWNGRKIHIGGIGGVMTRPDCRRQGYASLALHAAVETVRANQAAEFALLVCEPHNFEFYEARGWHPFTGELYVEQKEERTRFEAMAPFVFDFKRAPRRGTLDLCGLPW